MAEEHLLYLLSISFKLSFSIEKRLKNHRRKKIPIFEEKDKTLKTGIGNFTNENYDF